MCQMISHQMTHQVSLFKVLFWYVHLPSLPNSLFTVASEPTNLSLQQEGPTKMVISWDPPSPLGHTIGYRVYYTDQCASATDPTMDVSDTTTITLTELTGGCYYTVFVAGLSEHLPSQTENGTIYLGKIHWSHCIKINYVRYTFSMVESPPGKPVVSKTTKMATTISLSISVDYMPVGNYTLNVTWEKLSPCSDSENGYNMTVAPASTEFVIQVITGLDEGSTYNIVVTVANVAGNVTSDPFTATTVEAGNLHQFTSAVRTQ